MGKVLKNVLKFIAGLILGFVVLLLMETAPDVIDTLHIFVKGIDTPVIPVNAEVRTRWLIFIIADLVFVSLVTMLVRIFATSRNTDKLAEIVNVFAGIFAGIPFAALIFYAVDRVLLDRAFTDTDPIVRILVSCLIYALLFMGIGMIFEKSYVKKLAKPKKNCRLQICEALSDTEYEVKEVLLRKKRFQECYTCLRNTDRKPGSRQYFQIAEMNWTGKKEVDHWNYYGTGQLIEEPEEVFLPKMLLAEKAKNVHWGM